MNVPRDALISVYVGVIMTPFTNWLYAHSGNKIIITVICPTDSYRNPLQVLRVPNTYQLPSTNIKIPRNWWESGAIEKLCVYFLCPEISNLILNTRLIAREVMASVNKAQLDINNCGTVLS